MNISYTNARQGAGIPQGIKTSGSETLP